jgi:hypothetical protein
MIQSLRLPPGWSIGTGILLAFLTPVAALAQSGDTAVLSQIRAAAQAASTIDDDLFHIADAVGPRTTGSPALMSAEAWVLGRLRAMDLDSVRAERNPPLDIGNGLRFDPPGWTWSRLTVQQLQPWAQTLLAVPLLYSPPSKGLVRGEVVVAPLPRGRAAAVDSFITQHRGHLRDRFILLRDDPAAMDSAPSTRSYRYSAEELQEFSAAPGPDPAERPAERAAARQAPATAPAPPPNPFEQNDRIFEFLAEEGVLGLIGAAPTSSDGALELEATPVPPMLAAAPPAMFNLAPEHYNRLLRLVRRGIAVELEAQLESRFHEHVGTENLFGELRGSDRADEVVIVGAHLDSWHGGTGASDNAIGVAVVLEAARILTALPAPFRRTVVFAFWGGEELGLAGSRAYVDRYLTSPSTGELTPQGNRVSSYINLDYGGGRIRGIYLQGNRALKPLFDGWLAGVGDGTLVSTLNVTLGSDQGSFERAGIPGLSFIQDPMNYERRTHHTNMDDRDHVRLEDAQYNAATLASIIYRIANAENPLPRQPRP